VPNYDYKCSKCEHAKEVNKPISEASTIELCDKCGSEMSKGYGTFGIQFKGSGFYSTGG
jgi:putative FmdB family regulatory protein